jgi:hypothetical protein
MWLCQLSSFKDVGCRYVSPISWLLTKLTTCGCLGDVVVRPASSVGRFGSRSLKVSYQPCTGIRVEGPIIGWYEAGKILCARLVLPQDIRAWWGLSIPSHR